MSDASFSIIVVNFNYAAFLRQAIDSALAQTMAGCQVIVVDDASTDGSRAVIASYGDDVTAVYRDVNGGMAAAVNAGFVHATAPLVLVLDADDYLHPFAAERVAGAWTPAVAQVQARLHLVDAAGRVEDVHPPREIALDHGDVTTLLAGRGRYSTTVTSGLAYSRAALAAVMPIPEQAFDRSADGYLATVVPLYGQVAAIDEPIGGYRRHGGNHSGFGGAIARRARWRLDHDEHRYAALRDHAARLGVVVAAAPWRRDAMHLEQRLASLCLQPERHPYAGDRRGRLGIDGARAAFGTRLSLARRIVHAGLFLAAGFAPTTIARRVLAWKLERSSRPAAVDRLAGRLRRLLG